MPDKDPAIELVDVDVTGAELRADTVVIHDVNWRVNVGDFWVVAGLPGAGKTDLLATAAALQRPGKGQHFVFGRNLSQMEEDEQLRQRLRIGMVFQAGGRLFNQLNVLENLSLPICYHENVAIEEAREQAHAALEFVGLPNIDRRHPRNLTRNILQRVALARALMLKPEVILIDNPLLGIDARQIWWWRNFLPQLMTKNPLQNKPVSLVVASDELLNWRDLGAQFAIVYDNKWKIVGARADLQSSTDPDVLDLMTTEFKTQEK